MVSILLPAAGPPHSVLQSPSGVPYTLAACAALGLAEPPGGSAAAFAAGDTHACATDERGTYTWPRDVPQSAIPAARSPGRTSRQRRLLGAGACGACGGCAGTAAAAAAPSGDGRTLVAFPAPHSVVAAACGDRHTLALTATTGELYVWGEDDDGQLGLGGAAPNPRCTPTRCAAWPGSSFRTVAAGAAHSAAVTASGELLVWGCGYQHQLGLGAAASVRVPTRNRFFSGIPVAAVA